MPNPGLVSCENRQPINRAPEAKRPESLSSIPLQENPGNAAPSLFDLINCARAIEQETGMKWMDALRLLGMFLHKPPLWNVYLISTLDAIPVLSPLVYAVTQKSTMH